MVKNKLLLLQLKRIKLSPDSRPADNQSWQNFLSMVENSYAQTEQDRYLLERSMDISSREMRELYEKIASAARRVGMAEVSASILHNVGNILNSVNVSVDMILEHHARADMEKPLIAAEKIQKLIKTDKQNDIQANKLSNYLFEAIKMRTHLYDLINNDIKQLKNNIHLIGNFVSQQQFMCGNRSLVELVNISELIEESQRICGPFQEKYGIRLVKDIQIHESIRLDKVRFIQILVNLLQNAKDAVLMSERLDKIIKIELKRSGDNEIQLSVSDNGVGIDQDNLDKVFNFGFTTKKSGHGFGLHSSAIAAEQMGAKLRVSRCADAQGVVFTLTLYAAEQLTGEVAHE